MKTVKDMALRSMRRQKLPKKYNNDVMRDNMTLRVVLNAKTTDWNDLRNINDNKIDSEDRFYGDTKKLFNLIHSGKRGRITEKHGYRWLAWANNYREMVDILKKELKLTNDEIKDIDFKKVNMKEIERSILISCNEYMRDKIHWSKMGGE